MAADTRVPPSIPGTKRLLRTPNRANQQDADEQREPSCPEPLTLWLPRRRKIKVPRTAVSTRLLRKPLVTGLQTWPPAGARVPRLLPARASVEGFKAFYASIKGGEP